MQRKQIDYLTKDEYNQGLKALNVQTFKSLKDKKQKLTNFYIHSGSTSSY